MKRFLITFLGLALLSLILPLEVYGEPLRVATFRADATPPLGSPLCNGNVKPVMEIVTPLSARGVILLGDDKPIVLCAIAFGSVGSDWVFPTCPSGMGHHKTDTANGPSSPGLHHISPTYLSRALSAI